MGQALNEVRELPVYEEPPLLEEPQAEHQEHVKLTDQVEEIGPAVDMHADVVHADAEHVEESLTAVIAAHEESLAAEQAALDSVEDMMAGTRTGATMS